MDNSILCGKYLLNILKQNESLQTLMDVKQIYPIKAQTIKKVNDDGTIVEETKFPFVVYYRTRLNPEYTKDWISDNQIQYDFIVVSDDYTQSLELANAIRNALEGHQYCVEEITIQNIKLEDSTETTFEEAYIQTLSFSMCVNNLE